MFRFKFFVHCSGWATGGYENTHFAKSESEARDTVARWNAKQPGSVTLLSVEEISDTEFASDYIY